MRSPLPLLVALILLALIPREESSSGGVAAAPPAPAAEAPDLIVVPHLPAAARERELVAGQLLVDNPDAAGRVALLTGVSLVRADRPELVLFAAEPAHSLTGDPELSRIGALLERLPEALAGHRASHETVWGPADAEPLEGDAAVDAWQLATSRLDALATRLGLGAPASHARVDVSLPLWLLFDPTDAPGTTREVAVIVDWVDEQGASHASTTTRSVELLGPWGDVPPSLAQALPGTTLHAGDLHVHSCHGEALGACAPSGNCGAESLQLSGSFSYAQLKSQYQALGLDWFTATDHSYCIDSEAEYQVVAAECAALTDAGFIVSPDIELSSDEQGNQTGGDIGDLICIFATSSNHMGAHGISSQQHGGSEEFWGFCDGLFTDELDGFLENIAEVRAEGGWPIAHHPVHDSFAWNSYDLTQGIEANAVHGVEIWNGASSDGLGGGVQRWVDWMLDGRVLYAYSGSDTHDEAFAFGANRAVFLPGESFDEATLHRVLQEGRAFVSNGPSLILEVEQDGQSLIMGTIQSLASGQAPPQVTVRAHYDVGADPTTVTVFKGRVGDAFESVLCQSLPVTGAGVFECVDTVDPAARSWYRLFSSTASSAKEAYSNPVVFQPGQCPAVPYGLTLPAPHVGTLASTSSPALGSVNTLQISGFPNSGSAFLVAGLAPDFTGLPFKGGRILVSVPLALELPLPLTGGATSVTFSVPNLPELVGADIAWQAIAPDATQAKGFAFSNGLLTTICSPF
jgi:hypothetical protein